MYVIIVDKRNLFFFGELKKKFCMEENNLYMYVCVLRMKFFKVLIKVYVL